MLNNTPVITFFAKIKMKPSYIFQVTINRTKSKATIMHVGCCLLLGLIITLQSCKTAYVPNALNVPLLQEKGELKFLVSGRDFQAAYAISDRVGVIANAQFVKSDHEGSPDVTVNGKPDVSFAQNNSAIESGIGYLGKGERNLIYEVYGGGGFSRTHIADLNANNGVLGEIEAKGLKLFVQPNVGFATKYFDVALSSRFTALKYGTATTIYSKQYLIDQDLDQLADNTHMFLEPAITLRGGYKFIKIQAQFGLALKLSSATIPYNETLGNIGLVLDFAKWYKR